MQEICVETILNLTLSFRPWTHLVLQKVLTDPHMAIRNRGAVSFPPLEMGVPKIRLHL